ncbi:hypothetical protein BH11ARM2_BH11ARM2_25240 [soil metagenome]
MVCAVGIAVLFAVVRQISLARRYPDLPAQDLMMVGVLDALSGTRIAVLMISTALRTLLYWLILGAFLALLHQPDPWHIALGFALGFGVLEAIKKSRKLSGARMVGRSLQSKSDTWLYVRQETPSLGGCVREEMRRRSEKESARIEALA